MSQYKIGTVKVVSGEETVIGTGTAWLTEAHSGDLFKLRGATVCYEVANVSDDTHLDLTGKYSGATTSGETYVLARDFTDNLLLPEININDVEWPSLITEALRLIDTAYIDTMGATGPQGPSGPSGEKGDAGISGEKGETGAGLSILGEYSDIAALRAAHPTGNIGDAYLLADGSLCVWNEDILDWSDVGNIEGPMGPSGEKGDGAYLYKAYASSDAGADFTTTFNPALNYIAILSTEVEIPSPDVDDFTGLWFNYKGATGATGAMGPSGEKGLTGDDGLDITWKGAYSAIADYVINDAVSYTNGSSYICKLASTGNLPTDTTYWDILAQKGADGAGAGDVVGPNSSTNSNIALFEGVDGKLLKDSGHAITEYFSKLASGEIVALTNKTSLADADTIIIESNVDADAKRKISGTTLKSSLKSYFDTQYNASTNNQPLTGTAPISITNSPVIQSTSGEAAITIAEATQSVKGAMSAADKIKIDAVLSNVPAATAVNDFILASGESFTWKRTPLEEVKTTILRSGIPGPDRWSGETEMLVAHEQMALGKHCYMNSDGEAALYDADTATAPGMLLATASTSANVSGEFLKKGKIHLHSLAPGWTKGSPVYAGSGGAGPHTAGAINQAIPTGTGDQAQHLGIAYEIDVLDFQPEAVVVEVV